MPTTTLTTGSGPDAIAVGNLGNGREDIVVGDAGSNNVEVVLNGGNNVFASKAYSTGAGSGPDGVAIGDLNGDGMPDLAVADGSLGVNGGNVKLFLATSPGVYPSSATTTLPAGK